KKGIYSYVLTRKEKYLNIRAFTESQKRAAYERQNGVCPYCKKENRSKTKYDLSEMEADHITPWSQGGKTSADNCQMLCREHNRLKSDM
ncbi:MAG TPA: HNH endonuclease, partial [Candidatus Ornithoclostridium faecigallinarum]|nr:HNH endonuclease [Candidatus Ornithoclostridium faecigallinarum]